MDDTIVIRLTIIMIHTAQYNEIILLFFTFLKTSYKITKYFLVFSLDRIKLHNNCMYKSYVPWSISQIYT